MGNSSGQSNANINGFFEELFSKKLPPIRYDQHPADEILVSYLRGRLPKGWRDPDLYLRETRSGEVVTLWQRNEVTAHLLTCLRCRDRLELLREEISSRWSLAAWLERLFARVGRRLNPVPRPALVTMAAQFLVIIGLGALLFAQPSLFSAANTQVASFGSSVTTATPALPDPSPAFDPDKLRSFSTWDPQARFSAAEELSKVSDPSMIETLTNLYVNEKEPRIQQELAKALANQFSVARDQLETAITEIDQLQSQYESLGDYPLAASGQGFMKELNKSFHRLQDQGFDLGRQEIYCWPTRNLSMDEALKLLGDVDARLIIDPQAPQNTFAIQLPAFNPVNAQRQLEAGLGLECQ